MNVADIMTSDPAACTPETPLKEVAHMMIDHDCGAIPVVENNDTRKPVGIITDRDITISTVAVGKNPLKMTAAEIMTFPAEFVSEDTTLEECCSRMEKDMIRRMLVVDGDQKLCGIVAQADIALNAKPAHTAELVSEVSAAAHAAA